LATCLLATLSVPVCAGNYGGNYYPQRHRPRPKPLDGRDPALLTDEKNPKAVAEVMAGARTTANAAWWGFDEKDGTKAIQSALDSPAAKVVVPNVRRPWIVEPLVVRRDDLELVFEPGTVVLAKRDSFKGDHDSLITLKDRRNVTLRGYGATLRMCREYWLEQKYVRMNMGWRMGLRTSGCTGLKVLGLTICDCGGDGIYLGGPSNKDVVIKHVVCDRNHRQGLSVISVENLLVENSVFRRTRGTDPAAGIDLEPNSPREKMVNIRIRNCLFEDNDGAGIQVWLSKLTRQSGEVSVVCESNSIRGGQRGILVGPASDDGAPGQVEFRDNIVRDTSHAGVLIRSKSSRAFRVIFDGSLFDNVAIGTRPAYCYPAPILFHARGQRTERPGGIEFRNCFVHEPKAGDRVLRGGPTILVTPRSDRGVAWRDVTGQIAASVPTGARTEIHLNVEDFSLKLVDERAVTKP